MQCIVNKNSDYTQFASFTSKTMGKSGNKQSICYPIAILILSLVCIVLAACVLFLQKHQTKCDSDVAENGLINKSDLVTNKAGGNKVYHTPSSSSSSSTVKHSEIVTGNTYPKKVALGIVVCSTPGDLSPREEALIMLKSVVISSLLYKDLSSVEFHIFLERPENDETFFIENLKNLTNLHDLHVDLYFYVVFDIVPEEYHASMLYSDRRCGDAHLFFPDALLDLNSILYMDRDVIVTGSVAEIWGHLGKMQKGELIGAALDLEPDNTAYLEKYEKDVNEVPIPATKRVNTGVLLMNLKGMREYGWVSKLLQLKKDYSKLIHNMDDQRLVHTLIFYNSDILHVLPCQYNFRPPACNEGLYCNSSLKDPIGIQILHQYQTPEIADESNAFHDVADAFQNVNLSNPDLNLVRDLLIPIRKNYMVTRTNKSSIILEPPSTLTHQKCDGILDKLLFKKFFPLNNNKQQQL